MTTKNVTGNFLIENSLATSAPAQTHSCVAAHSSEPPILGTSSAKQPKPRPARRAKSGPASGSRLTLGPQRKPVTGTRSRSQVARKRRSARLAGRNKDVKSTPRSFECKQCDLSFPSQLLLTKHNSRLHNFKPRKCPEHGCISDEVFQTTAAYELHRRHAHDKWEKRGCPVPSCDKEDAEYPRASLRKHLKEAHKDVADEYIARYITTQSQHVLSHGRLHPALQAFKPQICPHPNCKSSRTFKLVGEFRQHASSAHGVFDDDMLVLLLLP